MSVVDLWRAGDRRVERWLGERWPGPAAALPAWAGDRAALSRALHAAGEPLAAQVLDPRVHVVVAGQQPAAAGGPLYGLIKALNARAIAAAMTAAGNPARALFWVASEDHDVGEAGRVDVLDRDGRILRVACDLGGGHAALRHRAATTWWDPVLSSLRARLGDGLGQEWLLRSAPLPGEGMGTWTCRLLRLLMPDVLVCEGHVLRGMWPDTAQHLTTQWPQRALLNEASDLIADGEAAPLGPLEAPPWFRDDDDARTALSAEEAASLLIDDPLRLSPGAGLRPILQQRALPCAVFVAGPGEMAYHAQLGPLYAAAGVHRPWIVPRVSVTIAPGWWRRGCRHYGSEPSEVIAGAIPHLRDDQLANSIHELSVRIDGLQAKADPATASALSRALKDLERAKRSRLSVVRSDLPPSGVLTAWARPRNKPQDRVLTLLQAIWQWGPGLVTPMSKAIAAGMPGEHLVVEV